MCERFERACGPKGSRAPSTKVEERELRLRYRVYAKRVESGKMTQDAADLGISRMRAIRNTLRMIRDATVAYELRRKREAAEHAAALEEIKKHLAVGAVLERFPDADVGLPQRPDRSGAYQPERESAAQTDTTPALHPERPPFDPDHQPEDAAA